MPCGSVSAEPRPQRSRPWSSLPRAYPMPPWPRWRGSSAPSTPGATTTRARVTRAASRPSTYSSCGAAGRSARPTSSSVRRPTTRSRQCSSAAASTAWPSSPSEAEPRWSVGCAPRRRASPEWWRSTCGGWTPWWRWMSSRGWPCSSLDSGGPRPRRCWARGATRWGTSPSPSSTRRSAALPRCARAARARPATGALTSECWLCAWPLPRGPSSWAALPSRPPARTCASWCSDPRERWA